MRAPSPRIRNSDTVDIFVEIDRDEIIVLFMLKDFRVGYSAGCNDPDDIAFDEPVFIACDFCILGLLQNGDFMSGFDEFVAQDDFLAEGQWVRHPQWGRGQIVSREGHGEKMKLSIRFGTQTKRIAVAYAQLEPA